MATFFIDTQTGQVATRRQLDEAGLVPSHEEPKPPWFKIKGTDDAITMWYAVMRKQTHGIFIGALCLRHSDHHASLLADGWEEVPVEEIAPDARGQGALRPSGPPRRHSAGAD